MGVSGKKVLVVDDEDQIRDIICKLLEKEDYTVAQAQNGKEALEMVRINPPDVIILDVRMPIMDGRLTRKMLLENPQTREIPVVFCTSESKMTLEDVITEIDDYIGKPVDFGELLKTLEMAFDGDGQLSQR